MTTTSDPLSRLLTIMARLRDPDHGCEWDLAQDFATIAPYTIEEAYEVADAIVRDDMAALREELGDLLLQVVFHSRMAEEAGHFTFADVADAIAAKMEARHPHIFGGADEAGQSREERWENAKAVERAAKGASSALDGVAAALPALMLAALIAGSPPPADGVATSPAGAYPGAAAGFTGTVRPPLGPGYGTRLVRFSIACCRLDATAESLELARDVHVPAGAWISARGRFVERHGRLVLNAERWRRIATPADPFSYR